MQTFMNGSRAKLIKSSSTILSKKSDMKKMPLSITKNESQSGSERDVF